MRRVSTREHTSWHRDDMPKWAWGALMVLRFAGAVIAALPLALAVAVAWWWTHPADPAHSLVMRRGFTSAVLREPAPELGERLERWRIVTTRGDTLRGLFRAAAPSLRAAEGPRPWAVVMLGGLGTGDRAALLLPDSLAVDALAMDWPWQGPRRMTWREGLHRLRRIRGAFLDAPAVLAHGGSALRRERGPARVAVLGASLGSPAAVAAVRLTESEALVVVDGFAGIEPLLDSEAQRALPHAWLDAALAPPLAALGARLLHALEPARHAEAAARLPVLLIDAEDEDRYPRECVRALHAAFPHAERRTHPGAHLRPEDAAQVRAIVASVDGWLRTLPDAGPGEGR